MGERELDPGSVFRSFAYDVNKATASLMYLLQGMESVRNSELPRYNQEPAGSKPYFCNFPKLSDIGVSPTLTGFDFDPNDLLARGGETEQLAFKGWVEQVYNHTWESQYRNEMRDSLEGPDIIRPQAEPIGDFRRIRNDLIHNHGIASVKESGKCKVLMWFKPGEHMILGMRHVFDFLNQMGMMSSFPVYPPDGRDHVNWTTFVTNEYALRNVQPSPRLVSLRTSRAKQLEDGSSWYVVSVVFENAVFVNIPVDYPPNGRSPRERNRFISKTRIDEDGNVRFPDGSVKDRESLYGEAVDALFNKGPKIDLGGIPGPSFRFREDDRITSRDVRA